MDTEIKEIDPGENMEDLIFIPDWQIELGKQELVNIAEGNAGLLEWNKAKSHFRMH